MPHPENEKLNIGIVWLIKADKIREKQGKKRHFTMRDIANIYDLAVSTVHEKWHKYKDKYDLPDGIDI